MFFGALHADNMRAYLSYYNLIEIIHIRTRASARSHAYARVINLK